MKWLDRCPDIVSSLAWWLQRHFSGIYPLCSHLAPSKMVFFFCPHSALLFPLLICPPLNSLKTFYPRIPSSWLPDFLFTDQWTTVSTFSRMLHKTSSCQLYIFLWKNKTEQIFAHRKLVVWEKSSGLSCGGRSYESTSPCSLLRSHEFQVNKAKSNHVLRRWMNWNSIWKMLIRLNAFFFVLGHGPKFFLKFAVIQFVH